MMTITILGTGAMGSRIGSNILKSGYKLNVWNRTASKCESLIEMGAKYYSTPRDAAIGANIVISILTDDDASKETWLNDNTGAILRMNKDSIAVECSTISLDWCETLAQNIHANSIPFLDAPILGSRPQAEAAQLIHLVGGQSQVLKKVSKVLSVSASSIHHVGEIGSAMAMKLAVNGLLGIQVSAFSEILGVLHKLGHSKQDVISLLNELPITSPVLRGVSTLISAENHTPLFPINLIEKDFGYLERMSKSKGAPIPLIEVTRSVLSKAIENEFGRENISSIARLYV